MGSGAAGGLAQLQSWINFKARCTKLYQQVILLTREKNTSSVLLSLRKVSRPLFLSQQQPLLDRQEALFPSFLPSSTVPYTRTLTDPASIQTGETGRERSSRRGRSTKTRLRFYDHWCFLFLTLNFSFFFFSLFLSPQPSICYILFPSF